MARPPSPFAFRDFRFYWGARLMATLGQMMMVVIIGWQVYDIARTTMPQREAALQLGLIGIAQFLPLVLLTLVVGWVADRLDRRWIARAAVLLECACAATLAYLTYTGTTTLPALFVIAALLGVARAFASPALQALSPNLVPAAVLPGAIDTAMLRASPNLQSGAEVLDPADVGQPDDIAALTAFLASDAAGFITGEDVVADGGRMGRL